ncbi:MAG TPA: cell division protein FtsQ/DivIB [Afifellaceae bacterium]|nr:cell division protein FtsQ/DivIB [Afifellaceae bacterium]
MRAVGRKGRVSRRGLGALASAVRSLPTRMLDCLPRRMRRSLEKVERNQIGPVGLYASLAFLGTVIVYGVIAGGHLNGLADRVLIGAGLGVEAIDIDGQLETSELAILERLEVDDTRSLLSYDVSEARNRIVGLPWIGSASVRKLYPNQLRVRVVERAPFALWQRGNVIVLIDRSGTPIIEYSDSRFASLPLVVGYGAESHAEAFLDMLRVHPGLSARTRASVFVAERRWNLVLHNGITIKLPESGAGAALAVLAKIDRDEGLLNRNITMVDLRLADRMIVRLSDEDGAVSEDDRVQIRQLAQAGGRT